jgi:signal transduction histidine kinase
MRTHAVPRRGPRRARSPLRTLAYQITVAETRERERIALGLHDEIGQFLTVARLKLGELRQFTGSEPASALLDDIAGLLAQASRATRSATFDLCSPVLRLGLEQALRSLAERLARDSPLDVSFECASVPSALPEAVLAVVFRSVRELCLNVQKHAGAGEVDISAQWDGHSLSVCVADDGVGFSAAVRGGGLGSAFGFGLASTHRQMQAIGGRLDLRSDPGCGTRATLVLPVAA